MEKCCWRNLFSECLGMPQVSGWMRTILEFMLPSPVHVAYNVIDLGLWEDAREFLWTLPDQLTRSSCIKGKCLVWTNPEWVSSIEQSLAYRNPSDVTKNFVWHESGSYTNSVTVKLDMILMALFVFVLMPAVVHSWFSALACHSVVCFLGYFGSPCRIFW